MAKKLKKKKKKKKEEEEQGTLPRGKQLYIQIPSAKQKEKIPINRPRNHYVNPKELGPDRIANSVAGYKIAESDVVIIDLGTATTFDVVNNKKEYLGGAIAPGIKISLDALTSNTASLKSVELDLPKKVVGKNTYEAIQSGLIFGHASMIDSMIERLLQELGTKPKIILTGGLSPIIQPALNLNAEYVEDLTLVGLEEIFNLNN